MDPFSRHELERAATSAEKRHGRPHAINISLLTLLAEKLQARLPDDNRCPRTERLRFCLTECKIFKKEDRRLYASAITSAFSVRGNAVLKAKRIRAERRTSRRNLQSKVKKVVEFSPVRVIENKKGQLAWEI